MKLNNQKKSETVGLGDIAQFKGTALRLRRKKVKKDLIARLRALRVIRNEK